MISIKDFLTYEVSSSWWARSVNNNYLQKLAAKYFAWKVKKKYARYRKSLILRAKMDESKN